MALIDPKDGENLVNSGIKFVRDISTYLIKKTVDLVVDVAKFATREMYNNSKKLGKFAVKETWKGFKKHREVKKQKQFDEKNKQKTKQMKRPDISSGIVEENIVWKTIQEEKEKLKQKEFNRQRTMYQENSNEVSNNTDFISMEKSKYDKKLSKELNNSIKKDNSLRKGTEERIKMAEKGVKTYDQSIERIKKEEKSSERKEEKLKYFEKLKQLSQEEVEILSYKSGKENRFSSSNYSKKSKNIFKNDHLNSFSEAFEKEKVSFGNVKDNRLSYMEDAVKYKVKLDESLSKNDLVAASYWGGRIEDTINRNSDKLASLRIERGNHKMADFSSANYFAKSEKDEYLKAGIREAKLLGEDVGKRAREISSLINKGPISKQKEAGFGI